MPATSLPPLMVETKLGHGVPFNLGDLVLCRYSTYPYWPATIDQTHEDGLWGTLCCTRPTTNGSLVLCLWCTFCNEDTGGWVRFDRIVRYHPSLADAIRVPKDHIFSKSQAAALSVAEQAFNAMPKYIRQVESVPRPPNDFFQTHECSADDIILPGESDLSTEFTPESVPQQKSAKKRVARRTFSGRPLSDDEADVDFAIQEPQRKIPKRCKNSSLSFDKHWTLSPSATDVLTRDRIWRRNGNEMPTRYNSNGHDEIKRALVPSKADLNVLLETVHVTVRWPSFRKNRPKLLEKTMAIENDVGKSLETLHEAFCNLGLSENAFAEARTRLEVRAEKAVSELETLCGEIRRLDCQIWSSRADVAHIVAGLPEKVDKSVIQKLQAVQLIQMVARKCSGIPSVRRKCESLCKMWTFE